MKKKEKAALGCVGVLGLIGIGVVVLALTGWTTVLKNAFILSTKASAMAELARKTPFSPAPGACLTEAQLDSYVEVSRGVKPAGDEIDAWESANQPADKSKPVIKARAAGLVGDYMQDLAGALSARGIGPSEFAWIGRRVARATSKPLPPDSCAAAERALVDANADRLRATALGPHARRIAFSFAMAAEPATR